MGALKKNIVWLVVALALTFTATAQSENRLTLDDFLSIESLGNAAVDPTGEWLAFERNRPYKENIDFSYRKYAFMKSGQQIWRLDLHGQSEAELLPGLDQGPTTFLQGFSPDGRYVTFFQYKEGQLKFGIYDNRSETAKYVEPVPATSSFGEHSIVWVDETSFVFAVEGTSGAPSIAVARAYTGEIISQAWRDAWSGDRPTANVIEANWPASNSTAREPNGRLVKIDAPSGQVQVLGEGVYSDVMLSPDGTMLAALRDTSLEALPNKIEFSQICIFDILNTQKRCHGIGLTYMSGTLTWAPDSRRMVAFAWPRIANIGGGHSGDPNAGRFVLLDVQTGAQEKFDHVGLDLVTKRERGDLHRPEQAMFLGQDLVVFARKIAADQDQSPRFTVHDIREPDLARADWYRLTTSGAFRNLTADLINVSPFPIDSGNESVSFASSSGIVRYQDNGEPTYLTEPIAKNAEPVTEAGYLGPNYSSLRKAENPILFASRSENGNSMYFVELGDQGFSGAIRSARLSSNETPLAAIRSPAAVVVKSRLGSKTTLGIKYLDGSNRFRTVATLNSQLTNIDVGSWETVTYHVADGAGDTDSETLVACVLVPPGFEGDLPPPLVVEVYPGVRPNCAREASYDSLTAIQPFSAYLWAARGYGYARISLPTNMIKTNDGPIAGMSALVDDAVDAIVDKGLADPDRHILLGISQGATSALYVAGQSDRFSAVIAANGWADLVSHYFGGRGMFSLLYGWYGEFDRYEGERGSDFKLGATPFEDPELYYRNSPILAAPKIRAPTLLVHSDMDSFGISQFDEMFGALLRAGKPVRYIRYWGEGHGPSSPANIRDMWSRFDTFLCDANSQSSLNGCLHE